MEDVMTAAVNEDVMNDALNATPLLAIVPFPPPSTFPSPYTFPPPYTFPSSYTFQAPYTLLPPNTFPPPNTLPLPYTFPPLSSPHTNFTIANKNENCREKVDEVNFDLGSIFDILKIERAPAIKLFQNTILIEKIYITHLRSVPGMVLELS
uniref:Uncharacterized protein n=1 Tax=Glossina brevipalpis TaxID=37001 RepID=A0A1A9W2A6_9MUSC